MKAKRDVVVAMRNVVLASYADNTKDVFELACEAVHDSKIVVHTVTKDLESDDSTFIVIITSDTGDGMFDIAMYSGYTKDTIALAIAKTKEYLCIGDHDTHNIETELDRLVLTLDINTTIVNGEMVCC